MGFSELVRRLSDQGPLGRPQVGPRQFSTPELSEFVRWGETSPRGQRGWIPRGEFHTAHAFLFHDMAQITHAWWELLNYGQ